MQHGKAFNVRATQLAFVNVPRRSDPGAWIRCLRRHTRHTGAAQAFKDLNRCVDSAMGLLTLQRRPGLRLGQRTGDDKDDEAGAPQDRKCLIDSHDRFVPSRPPSSAQHPRGACAVVVEHGLFNLELHHDAVVHDHGVILRAPRRPVLCGIDDQAAMTTGSFTDTQAISMKPSARSLAVCFT